MQKFKKVLSLILVVAMTAGIAVSGTVAYLTSEDSDVNVMTVGNVKIAQNEYERGVNADGTYQTITTERGTGYKLVDFTQAKPLMPAVGTVTGWDDTRVFFEQFGKGHELGAMDVLDGLSNVQDKFVFVENTGRSDAYVRTIIAFEAGSASVEEWGELINTSAHTFWDYKSLDTTVKIGGNNYVIMVCDYTGAEGENARHPDGIVHPGDYTYNNLAQVYMDSAATNDDVEKLDGNKNGMYDILVLSQAVQAAGFDDAETALNTAFGDVTAENAAVWFADLNVPAGSDAPAPPVEVPENATPVTDIETLSEALSTGGDYVIESPITVSKNLVVAADTALYCTDANNVVSFENNSKISVNANQSLALYGVQMDGNGTYGFSSDDEIVYDADARRTTPLLNVGAGAALTLGTQTNIENVVAKGSAVISARGTDDNRAKVVIEHASITNCAGESGTIINVDKAGDVVIGEGTVISNNASYNNNNHGIIRVYNAWDAANPSTVTMNGGEICNNYYSGNGMVGLYYGKMTMNGGKICDNSWFEDNQKHNGFYPVVYVHSNSQFVMNGGEISGNSVRFGALNCLNSALEPAIVINGGTVTDNTNTDTNTDAFAAVVLTEEGKTYKSVSVSENADVTGTVWDYYTGYYTLKEYLTKIS